MRFCSSQSVCESCGATFLKQHQAHLICSRCFSYDIIIGNIHEDVLAYLRGDLSHDLTIKSIVNELTQAGLVTKKGDYS